MPVCKCGNVFDNWRCDGSKWEIDPSIGVCPFCRTCELCAEKATHFDSVPAPVPGPHHENVCGYRLQLLCDFHAAERRKTNTSRVEPIHGGPS